MKRFLAVVLASGLLTSCSVNYSPTEITFNQTGSGTMKTDAQGLTTATTPTQDASGSAAADGGLASLGGIRDAVGKLVPDMSQKTTTTTTKTEIKEEVKPAEPSESEGLEDAPVEPEGQIEEIE